MRKALHIGAVLALIIGCRQVQAAETILLGDIIVTETKLITPTKQTNETVYTGSEITKEGIEALGAKAAVSVYEAINILPGVSVEGVDPYGLAAEQNNIRIRGVRGFLGALSVAGIPNYGGNPMGPREYLYDMENIESIAVYKGAVPADLGTGVGSRGGAIELRPLWPKEDLGLTFSQGFGADSYLRSFLRLDSGSLPNINTRLSASASYTEADKWKGSGDLGPRKNLNLMLSQPINDKDKIQLWFNHNDFEQNLYKALSYNQVEDLSTNYKVDYNGTKTGTAADINYYDYNRGEYANSDVLSILPYTFSNRSKITVKPYFSHENTEILQGTGSMGGSIQKRLREIDRYGFISQFDYSFDNITASLGYWFEDSDMEITQRFYNPVNFQFKGYGMVMENDDDGIAHSPYLKLAGSNGSLDWQAGLKYFYYRDPASQGYTASAPGYQLVKAADLYREEASYDALLPTLGIDYHLGDNLELTASYGRSQIRPYAYVPLVTTYNSNRADFQAARVSLNDMFKGYDMETTDTIEVGTRYHNERAEIIPTLFLAKHKNLLTTVHDPRIGVNGVNYYQNIGEATSYGIELVTNVFLGNHLTFYCNPTYTSLTYDDDLTFAGATLDTKDNQVVDTPEWMIKTGLIFNWANIEVIPTVRYLGERYGDAENTEKIDDYFVADLRISYGLEKLAMFKQMKVALELTNLFDKEYVSTINAMDDSRAGSTSYNVGAPFTAMVSLSFQL